MPSAENVLFHQERIRSEARRRESVGSLRSWKARENPETTGGGVLECKITFSLIQASVWLRGYSSRQGLFSKLKHVSIPEYSADVRGVRAPARGDAGERNPDKRVRAVSSSVSVNNSSTEQLHRHFRGDERGATLACSPGSLRRMDTEC